VRKDKPSITAYKVAINLVTLGTKPGMDTVLPLGMVEATKKLLVASGAARQSTVQWASSPRMVSVYEAYGWVARCRAVDKVDALASKTCW
jgi:hypothetical protein